jgi:hypothetical protein
MLPAKEMAATGNNIVLDLDMRILPFDKKNIAKNLTIKNLSLYICQ